MRLPFGRRDPAREAAAESRLRNLIVDQRHFLFVRVETDYRPVEFLPDGTIGRGAGESEQTWRVATHRGKTILRISGSAGVASQLELEETGTLRGRCLAVDKTDLLLLPADDPTWSRPKISFYTTCMGRLHHLRLTMPVNLRAAASYGNVEFVLLNYNSPDGLDDWVQAELAPYLDSGVVQYYKTTRPQKYDSSKAKNTAARLATGDIVCNLDADNWLGHGFAEHLATLFDAPRTIVRAECPWGGVYGRISVFREDFLALGGHDESFRGYGFDDTDFINRARAAGFVDRRFAAKYALCLSHSNGERTEHMAIDQKTSRRENKLKSARNIKRGLLVANAGKAWGDEPVVKNSGELVAA